MSVSEVRPIRRAGPKTMSDRWFKCDQCDMHIMIGFGVNEDELTCTFPQYQTSLNWKGYLNPTALLAAILFYFS